MSGVIVHNNESATVKIEINQANTVKINAIGGSSGGGSGIGNFIHNQEIASDIWTITHNLVYFPNVTIVDSSGRVVEGEIEYINQNSLIVYFNGAFAGKAYLS